MVTATRIEKEVVGTRTLYKLSEPIRQFSYGDTTDELFEYVVLSLGRIGDTVVFVADESGGILDFAGLGESLPYWIHPSFMDDYVQECLDENEKRLENV